MRLAQRSTPRADALPPFAGVAAAIAVDENLLRTAASFAHQLFVGLADVDPLLDLAGQILLPQVGLVVGADSAAELQRLIGMQREGEDAQHHALVGFRRVPRERQRVVAVVVAVDVRDSQRRLADG